MPINSLLCKSFPLNFLRSIIHHPSLLFVTSSVVRSWFHFFILVVLFLKKTHLSPVNNNDKASRVSIPDNSAGGGREDEWHDSRQKPTCAGSCSSLSHSDRTLLSRRVYPPQLAYLLPVHTHMMTTDGIL